MQFLKTKRRKPQINIVPLVDILSILLIFFIVTSTFRKTESTLKIKLPNSSQAKPTEDSFLDIHVTKDEKIFLNEEEVDCPTLIARLKEKMKVNAEMRVSMRASKDAPFSIVLQVLDAAKEAGLKNLSTYAEPYKNTLRP